MNLWRQIIQGWTKLIGVGTVRVKGLDRENPRGCCCPCLNEHFKSVVNSIKFSTIKICWGK